MKLYSSKFVLRQSVNKVLSRNVVSVVSPLSPVWTQADQGVVILLYFQYLALLFLVIIHIFPYIEGNSLTSHSFELKVFTFSIKEHLNRIERISYLRCQ